MRRLPNNYGSVTKLSGSRRRPYIVKKVKGWKENGQPIYAIVGYAVTREEGLALLAAYNADPWDVDKAKITLNQLFELWKTTKLPKLGRSLGAGLKSSYKHITDLSEKPYRTIKAFEMQKCIDDCERSPSTQATIKNLWRHLDRFALELDIPTKSYSSLLTAESIPPTSRVPFSKDEIKTLWEHQADPWIDTVLILIYSGWRITEFVNLTRDDIDLVEGTMRGGIKTDAGKNRIVPIHSKIRPLIEHRFAEGEYYLVPGKHRGRGKQCIPQTYRTHFYEALTALGMSHTPHECRHTFETLLDAAGANRRCIDLMMGHVSKDTGNRVYNHKTLDDLREAIELITD